MGECLRFLWKHRQVPTKTDHHTWEWGSWVTVMPKEFWRIVPDLYNRNLFPVQALDRVVEIWPLHKHLLIDALEKETVT